MLPSMTTETNGHRGHDPREERPPEVAPDYDAMSPDNLLKLATEMARQSANSAFSADAKASDALRRIESVRVEVRGEVRQVGERIDRLTIAMGHQPMAPPSRDLTTSELDLERYLERRDDIRTGKTVREIRGTVTKQVIVGIVALLFTGLTVTIGYFVSEVRHLPPVPTVHP
jgi:hypothetical protein